jgi:hypothetical protein
MIAQAGALLTLRLAMPQIPQFTACTWSATGTRVRLCRGIFAFGASVGVVELIQLSPRQRRGFLDGLLSREGVGAQPA